MYPLICSQIRCQKVLKDVCNKDNIDLVKRYLDEKPQLEIPKHIIIKQKDRDLYLGQDMTRISQHLLKRNYLTLQEKESSYVITKQKKTTNDEESDDDVVETDNNSEDDSEEIEDTSEEILNLDQLMEVLNSSTEGNQPSSDEMLPATAEIHSLTEVILPSTEIVQPPPEVITPSSQSMLPSSECIFPTNERMQPATEEMITSGEHFDIIFNSSMVEQESEMDESNCDNINERMNSSSPDEVNGASSEGNDASMEECDGVSTEENDIPSESNLFRENNNSLPREKMKYINIFLHPELCSSEDIRNLIHISKDQFLDFVNAIRSHLEKLQRHLDLSVFSLALLFRMKLAKCKSFAELSTLFVISRSTARRVYRRVLHIVYRYHSAIPNILSGPDTIEKLFEDAAQGMDPFFKALFTPFEDPKGKTLFFSVKNAF